MRSWPPRDRYLRPAHSQPPRDQRPSQWLGMRSWPTRDRHLRPAHSQPPRDQRPSPPRPAPTAPHAIIALGSGRACARGPRAISARRRHDRRRRHRTRSAPAAVAGHAFVAHAGSLSSPGALAATVRTVPAATTTGADGTARDQRRRHRARSAPAAPRAISARGSGRACARGPRAIGVCPPPARSRPPRERCRRPARSWPIRANGARRHQGPAPPPTPRGTVSSPGALAATARILPAATTTGALAGALAPGWRGPYYRMGCCDFTI